MAVELKRGPTPAMQDWIKELGVIVAMPIDETGEIAAPGNGSGAQPSSTKPRPAQGPQQDAHDVQKASFSGAKSDLVGLGDVPDPIGSRSCTCIVINNTDQILQLDPASATEVDNADKIGLGHGEYKARPPQQIGAQRKDGKFKAVNKQILILPHTTGVEGRVRYFLDDQKKASWTLHFDNPAVKTSGNTGDATLAGPKEITDKFEAPDPDFDEGPDPTFTFILNPIGGPNPNPNPNPQPQPGPTPDITASCQISVVNNTKVPLKLAHQDNELGDFMTSPSASIAPGTSTAFAYVETPHPKNKDERGCKGSLTWEVGSPATATWRVEWNNPLGQKNTASAKVDPQSSGFESLEQAGQGDENVPVTFTLSGGGGGDGPGPKPVEPEPPFEPPVADSQPTFRKGDKSRDGWVEYLQQLLNLKLKPSPNLKEDGDFGQATLNAVRAYQKQEKLQVDGVAGNQTWASLRDGAPEKPATDGRQPHTFVEQGKKARWSLEDEVANYETATDTAKLLCNSVGDDVKLEGAKVTVRVTAPGAKAKTVIAAVGAAVGRTPTDQGDKHFVTLEKFKETFPSTPPGAKSKDYVIEAYFDKSVGGDFIKTGPLGDDH